ncbi:hypothetical protein L3i22_059950 [Actinoplanes sp. L3-i22]|nr:hypothetical protein L3i22_059950 [Actinoplanes sp. L3-i22]
MSTASAIIANQRACPHWPALCSSGRHHELPIAPGSILGTDVGVLRNSAFFPPTRGITIGALRPEDQYGLATAPDAEATTASARSCCGRPTAADTAFLLSTSGNQQAPDAQAIA